MTSIRKLRGRFYRKAGGPRGIGNRCTAYFAGCIVCECYRYLDERGRFPTFEEIRPVCDALSGNPPASEINELGATPATGETA